MTPSSPADEQEWLVALSQGDIGLLGRVPWGSNATFLLGIAIGGCGARGIYKPGRGERPLWDFPGGLFRREAAAYELSVHTELRVVPETIIRDDGPLGRGSLQRFIDADFQEHYFTLLESAGYEEALRELAGFDLLANNADRKGGHVLVDGGGKLWGIDNGLCFHTEDKLRTVMWDFAGEQLPSAVMRACEIVADSVPPSLSALLDEDEVTALQRRACHYLEYATFPAPRDDHRAYPWPLV